MVGQIAIFHDGGLLICQLIRHRAIHWCSDAGIHGSSLTPASATDAIIHLLSLPICVFSTSTRGLRAAVLPGDMLARSWFIEDTLGVAEARQCSPASSQPLPRLPSSAVYALSGPLRSLWASVKPSVVSAVSCAGETDVAPSASPGSLALAMFAIENLWSSQLFYDFCADLVSALRNCS